MLAPVAEEDDVASVCVVDFLTGSNIVARAGWAKPPTGDIMVALPSPLCRW